MKARKIVSVILCVVFLLITLLLALLVNYLGTGGHPGLNTESFAPVKVIKVSDKNDITVTVYPTGGILPHGVERDTCLEVNLNCIKKGWLVEQYEGNCRLLFEINNADMEDFCGLGDNKHYYYAEIIPSTRLMITDITARHGDEPADPFTEDARPNYLTCCINEELNRYETPRYSVPFIIASNIVFILVVISINVLINKISIAKAKKKASQNA